MGEYVSLKGLMYDNSAMGNAMGEYVSLEGGMGEYIQMEGVEQELAGADYELAGYDDAGPHGGHIGSNKLLAPVRSASVTSAVPGMSYTASIDRAGADSEESLYTGLFSGN